MSVPRILIVEDEASIRDLIASTLELAGFECIAAETPQQAHVAAVDAGPDLILLDWMLPGGSGVEFARRLKTEHLTADIPIIMLTARTAEENKLQGFNAGVDDYVTKPFSPRELVARVKAVLRRSGGRQAEGLLRVLDLELDPASHRVSIEGHAVDIGPTEFRLLKFFMSHQEKVFSRDNIQDQVWGGNVYLEERTIDVHIRRLRKALGSVPHCRFDYAGLVQTVRGAGYRFSNRPD